MQPSLMAGPEQERQKMQPQLVMTILTGPDWKLAAHLLQSQLGLQPELEVLGEHQPGRGESRQ